MLPYIPDIPDDVDTVTAAIEYAKAGLYVLPVRRTKKKHPGSVVGTGWPTKSSRDPQQIAAWFAGNDYNIAIHCGRSGLVVFDVDHPKLKPEGMYKDLNEVPYQSTRIDYAAPGRGHYIFRQPAGRNLGNSNGDLGGRWGEVRGNNGVIIVAPSEHSHPDGQYRWVRTGPIPELPKHLADKLRDACDAESAVSDAVVAAFIASCTERTRPGVLHGFRTAWENKTGNGESRHVTMVPILAGAMKEARAGFYTAQEAIDMLRPRFIAAMQDSTLGTGVTESPAAAGAHFDNILGWAVAQALAADLDQVRARTAEKLPEQGDSASEFLGGPTPSGPAEDTTTSPPTAQPMSRAEAHKVFTKWLGEDYDTDALDAELATLAVEKFEDGSDPIWLLLISGSGNAKTEAVQATAGAGAIVTSSISSDAALLSATPKRERTKGSSGGLLRLIGGSGVLAIKDVTSILSMNRDLRAKVLAALREIYDGRWTRDVGSDGGHRIEWAGRIAVIGAVTTAWDTAHGVVSSMGDRFVLIRMDSTTGRTAAGRKAIGNTGSEPQMRAELAAAVAGVIAGMDTNPTTVTEEEVESLLAAADLVTLARTAVEFDYRGDVIDAHAPEMPTRFAKQLTQIVRGAVAVGMEQDDALRLAIRCARDSMPPLRLAIIEDLAENPATTPSDVRRRINKPWATVDRQLQALHMLGIADVDEVEYGPNGKSRWYYTLSPKIDPDAIKP